MLICYVDESGNWAPLTAPNCPVDPVLVIAGFVIDQHRLANLTGEFLRLKRRFFPGRHRLGAPQLDGVLIEIKGSELRKSVAVGTHRERSHVLGFLDNVVGLLVRHDAMILGRVWIKGVRTPFVGRSVHTSSVQYLCAHFQALLEDTNDTGMMLIDSRSPNENAWVSHSIFTQKFRVAGDAYSRILELPSFGHSQNHVGIQLADILCSGLLFPMSVHAYCVGHINNLHVRQGYQVLRPRYGWSLQHIQFRQRTTAGKWEGGITVCDAILQRPGGLLFK